MSSVVRLGLVQAKWEGEVEAMIQKHESMIDEAAARGVQIVCLQELFCFPYFPAGTMYTHDFTGTLQATDIKWYESAEPVPGPLTDRMQEKAKTHQIVLIAPVYEKVTPDIHYNTSVVFDADGSILGKYRKSHVAAREAVFFKPGDLGYPVFDTRYAKVGIYTCYDRHFPEGARILGLNGAEIVFSPSCTGSLYAKAMWDYELRAHAIYNGYFTAAVNRVGAEEAKQINRIRFGRDGKEEAMPDTQSGGEKPLSHWELFGSSYVCNPLGEIMAKGSEDKDEVVIADVDLNMLRDVREYWSFYKYRRPETYHKLVEEG